MPLDVVPIPCLRDNYAYLLVHPSGEAVVVDASEAEPVRHEVESRGLRLVAVLTTHHHHDHVGGNEALARAFPELRVFGHESEATRIPGLTDRLTDGASLRVGPFEASAMHVPGHTLGALTYLVDAKAFTGDTLFLAGCGRLFEGTPAMMHRSLNGRLAELDPATRIYPGHEYTVANLQFAASIEPDNARIAARLVAAIALQKAGVPTVGATLAEELATNPFLRCDESSVAIGAGFDPASLPKPAVDVFAALRAQKDVYRPPAV